VICIAFLFNIWQFTQSAGRGSPPSAASIPPVPTPSLYSTTTDAAYEQCTGITYAVQQNDSLQSIAKQFSIPAEQIMTANHLDRNFVHAPMILSIPLCGETPGSPRTATNTFTPLLDPTTSTPVKGPTQ
jgi:LysM repeat protein